MTETPLQRQRSKILTLIAVSCVLSGCQTLPHGGWSPSTTGQEQAVSGKRLQVVQVASRMIGTPYRYGGNTTGGFDCSGLVQYVHGLAGISVPRTTSLQWQSAAPLRRRHLIPGDLVFFSLSSKKTSHVGIYEGGGRFIHAPSSGKVVSRASLDNPFWRRHLVGGRSFL